MKTALLVQDHREVDIENLAVTREGKSLITGQLKNEHVSLSPGDAGLVIDGTEFDVMVSETKGRNVSLASDHFEEIAGRIG